MEIPQKAIAALLERCDREDANIEPSRRFLYTSEIRHLLGVAPEKPVNEASSQQATEQPADDTGHIDVECTNRDCLGCMFCDGGLWGCNVCRGLEGSMPSTCPGEDMTAEQSDAVYAGRLDFRDGQWVEGVASRFCPKGLWGDAK